MAYCNTITGIAAGCTDNNLGAIKKAWIADFEDVASYTVDAGLVEAISMTHSGLFHAFEFKQNTSMYTENAVVDLTADVNLWESNINLGLRRIEVSKRNSISILAEGRRRVIIVTQDNNDDYRIWGLDDGMRMSTMESGTNTERGAGTFYNLNFIGHDRWMAYDFDNTLLAAITA